MRIALVEPSPNSTTYCHPTSSARGAMKCSLLAMLAKHSQFPRFRQRRSHILLTSTELKFLSSGIQLVQVALMFMYVLRPLYIILMSSSAERSRMVEALNSGADDFISKPPA